MLKRRENATLLDHFLKDSKNESILLTLRCKGEAAGAVL